MAPIKGACKAGAGNCFMVNGCPEGCRYKSSAEELREKEYRCGGIKCGQFHCSDCHYTVNTLSPVETKPTNPKDAVGSNKVPLHLWPETATALGAMGLLDGALKYGRGNYREIGVRASIYQDAARRHIGYWFEGEDTDPDSGLPHLAHALACLAILVDADAAGKLNDDRQIKGGFRKLMEKLTPHVSRLKALHRDKSPKHYTIEDSR